MHCSLKGHKHFLLYGTHTHKKTLFYMAFNLQFLNIRNVFNGYDASSSRFPPPTDPPSNVQSIVCIQQISEHSFADWVYS